MGSLPKKSSDSDDIVGFNAVVKHRGISVGFDFPPYESYAVVANLRKINDAISYDTLYNIIEPIRNIPDGLDVHQPENAIGVGKMGRFAHTNHRTAFKVRVLPDPEIGWITIASEPKSAVSGFFLEDDPVYKSGMTDDKYDNAKRERSKAFVRNLPTPNLPESVQEASADNASNGEDGEPEVINHTEPVEVSCMAITENGIEPRSFKLDVNALNGWLASIGAMVDYDVLLEDLIMGTEMTIKLDQPISSVSLLMPKAKVPRKRPKVS